MGLVIHMPSGSCVGVAHIASVGKIQLTSVRVGGGKSETGFELSLNTSDGNSFSEVFSELECAENFRNKIIEAMEKT